MHKPFSFDQVRKACMEYFQGDELAVSTWMSKYALKNNQGEFFEADPSYMHRRLAHAFYLAESRYPHKPGPSHSDYGKTRIPLNENFIYHLLHNFRYLIPQGSVMFALGNPFVFASLSNCVVLPEIYDSYGGILFTDQQLVQLFKRRCGVGIDISSLRPAGNPVSNAAVSTSGAVSFMDRFSHTTREVAQNGRRGALMITMDVHHPDILSFIRIKQDLQKVTAANISIRLSDAFMQSVEKGQNHRMFWPLQGKPSIEKEMPATALWDEIIRCAHQTAEPGLIFWDRQHTYSTSSVYPQYKNHSTNPCSEIAMQGGDSCRLMALNLLSFVENPFTDEAFFDMEKFYQYTYESQRLMDDLVDLELEAIEKILEKIHADPEPDHIKQAEIQTWELLYKNGREGRRTGLGFTAMADMLAGLNLKFDSEQSLSILEQIMKTKCRAEFDSSIDMALERGSFTGFNTEIENTSEFIQMLKQDMPDLYTRMMQYGRRNISLSTVAPTGSVSILARTSSGIEPVFMLNYKRRKKVNPSEAGARVDYIDPVGDSWQEFEVMHPGLQAWLEKNPGKDITESPYAGSSATEISWEKRVQIQSLVQKYVTHSISSTINLPGDVSPEKVAGIYMQAWKQGLKGITVYRDGARSGVMLAAAALEQNHEVIFAERTAPPRPPVLEADVVRFLNESERWIAFIGLLDGKPYEIFTGRASDSFHLPENISHGWIHKIRESSGKRYDFEYLDEHGQKTRIEGLSRSFDKEFWNYAKLISGILRHGMPLPQVIDLVMNLNLDRESINTWKNGVGRALKRYIPDGTPANDRQCPECGDPNGLIYEEGCLKCRSCTLTKCS